MFLVLNDNKTVVIWLCQTGPNSRKEEGGYINVGNSSDSKHHKRGLAYFISRDGDLQKK